MGIQCADRLDKLTVETVRRVYPHQRKQPRNKVCRNWTPDSVALEVHLKRVRLLSRMLNKAADPTERTYRRAIRYGSNALGKLARSPEQLTVFESLTQYNTAYWSALHISQARDSITAAMAEIKEHLSDDMKRSRRKAFLLSIRKRNYEVQLGKIKGPVLMISGRRRNHSN